MIQIGKFSKLEILKELDFGIYLDGGPYGELLLPRKFVPE
ncbi:MAG: putative RNA-binding protein (virulence factor B family), partial [Saprospiraceae bacterium]